MHHVLIVLACSRPRECFQQCHSYLQQCHHYVQECHRIVQHCRIPRCLRRPCQVNCAPPVTVRLG